MEPDRRSGITVGVDGSVFSDAAVRWAATDAAMHHETLTLIAILPRDDITIRNEYYVRRLRNIRRLHAESLLTRAREIAENTVGGMRPLPSILTEFKFAPPVPALVAESRHTRMMVVGSRGLGALDRLTLGSVSTGLIQHSHCPVAVIHDATPTPPSKTPILLGIDGSPASELATAIAFDEASRRRAPLSVMHAWAGRVLIGHKNWKFDKELGRAALFERLAGWRERHPDVTVTPHLVHDDPANWLVNHANGHQLLVVGSHGRGGFTGMLLGSVASTTAHAVKVPIIVARR